MREKINLSKNDTWFLFVDFVDYLCVYFTRMTSHLFLSFLMYNSCITTYISILYLIYLFTGGSLLQTCLGSMQPLVILMTTFHFTGQSSTVVRSASLFSKMLTYPWTHHHWGDTTWTEYHWTEHVCSFGCIAGLGVPLTWI